jgi:DNA-binding transcriptional ArsR family regulator
VDFTPVIDELQARREALNSTIAMLKMLQAGDTALKFEEEVDAMPPIIQDSPRAGKKPAAKAKAAPKQKKPKSSKGGKREAILSYLRQHQSAGAVEIAKALGFSRSATTWNLSEARDAGLVKIEGKSSNATWSLVKQDATPRTPPPSDPEEPESSLECKFCHAPCASKERLERHMRLVHNR